MCNCVLLLAELISTTQQICLHSCKKDTTAEDERLAMNFFKKYIYL